MVTVNEKILIKLVGATNVIGEGGGGVRKHYLHSDYVTNQASINLKTFKNCHYT